jgi:hypothetical protein
MQGEAGLYPGGDLDSDGRYPVQPESPHATISQAWLYLNRLAETS